MRVGGWLLLWLWLWMWMWMVLVNKKTLLLM